VDRQPDDAEFVARLQIDEKTGAGSQQVKERLKAILEEHDRAITSAGPG
jgi:hypothetical protein